MASAAGAGVGGQPEELSVWELGEQVRKGAKRRDVRVRGVVVQVSGLWRPNTGNGLCYLYGELRDENQGAAMAFHWKGKEDAPYTGERVVLEGQVEVAYNTDLKRFELRLQCAKAGRWGADVPLTELVPTAFRRAPLVERTRARVGIGKLVRETEGRVVLVGTRRGMTDVQGAAERVGSPVVFEKVEAKVLRWKTMLEAVKGVVGRCDGVCLVRGGGDPEDFACWNEPEFVRGLLATGMPFYTGVGHADYEPTLADLRADESFGTPAEFGATYATAWAATKASLAERMEAERTMGEQRRHVETLQSLVAAEQRSNEGLAKELRGAVERREVLRARIKALLWVCGVLVLVIAGLWVRG